MLPRPVLLICGWFPVKSCFIGLGSMMGPGLAALKSIAAYRHHVENHTYTRLYRLYVHILGYGSYIYIYMRITVQYYAI